MAAAAGVDVSKLRDDVELEAEVLTSARRRVMGLVLALALAFLGEGSATSAHTADVSVAPATASSEPSPTPSPSPKPPGFPASFFTGPLGTANILPGKTTGALLGSWAPGTPPMSWTEQQAAWERSEAYIGRRYDMYALHYAAPVDGCHWGGEYEPFATGREQWIVDRGGIPIVNWSHGWTPSATNAGQADACIRSVARRAAALPFRVLLRTYWEFNGDWFRWSSSGQAFIDMWRRTARIFKEEGATNVGFIWSPDGGSRDRAFASYPGDEWVDWVGVSLYNWNKQDAWCSPFGSGWCEFAPTLSHDPVRYPTIYDVYSARKPFLVAESGSVEDASWPGRKSQWFRNARDEVPVCCPNLRGLSYFDVNVWATEGVSWTLNGLQSSMDGWRDLALSPFFRTRESGFPAPTRSKSLPSA